MYFFTFLKIKTALIKEIYILLRKQTELIKSGQLEDINVDTFAQKTAQDFEDASQEEREKFQPAQRIRGLHILSLK